MRPANRHISLALTAPALAFAACAGSFAHSARADVITNGGFESGLAGWSVSTTDPNAQYGLESNFGHTGTHSFRFGSSTTQTELAVNLNQTLPQGQSFEISIWIYNLGAGNDTLGVLASEGEFVGASNSFILGLVDHTVPTELETWEHLVVPFQTLFDTNRLRIFGNDNSAAFYVDDIQITAVPAPSAGVLLMVTGGLASRRRR